MTSEARKLCGPSEGAGRENNPIRGVRALALKMAKQVLLLLIALTIGMTLGGVTKFGFGFDLSRQTSPALQP